MAIWGGKLDPRSEEISPRTQADGGRGPREGIEIPALVRTWARWTRQPDCDRARGVGLAPPGGREAWRTIQLRRSCRAPVDDRVPVGKDQRLGDRHLPTGQQYMSFALLAGGGQSRPPRHHRNSLGRGFVRTLGRTAPRASEIDD